MPEMTMMMVTLYVIRMESFPESASRLLREFKLQLSLRPPLLSAERLLQITAVNMFSVDSTTPAGRIVGS